MITYRVTKIDEGSSDEVCVFGQLVFTGNYVTGGDSITFDYATAPFTVPQFPNPFPVYRKTSSIHATKPPITWAADMQGLFIPVVILGKGATDLKLILLDTQAGGELAAAPYPASITGNPFNSMELSYRKNL